MNFDYSRDFAAGAAFAALRSYMPPFMFPFVPGTMQQQAQDFVNGIIACYGVDYLMSGGYSDYMTAIIRGGALALGANVVGPSLTPLQNPMLMTAAGAAIGAMGADFAGY